MRPRRWACLLALAAACLPAAAGWRQFDSEHFTLYSQGHEASVREHLQSLEAFRWLALKLLRADESTLRAQSRFEIVLLRNEARLRQLMPQLAEGAVGVYVFCNDGAVAWAVDDPWTGGRGVSWNQAVQQHEVAHHLMFQYATVRYPAWYTEGFAEYMSTTALDDGVLVVGDRNLWRAGDLERGNLPYEQLLRWSYGSGKAPPLQDLQFLYGQAWLLTHYLLSDDERTVRMGRYFERVGAGEDPVAAFEPTIGVAVADLPGVLRWHLTNLQRLQLRGARIPQATIQVQALSDDAGAVLEERMLLRGCPAEPRLGELARALRGRAATPDAGPATRRTLARAEVLSGQPAAALALLEPLLAADDGDAEAHLLAGRSWLQRAATLPEAEGADALERARNHLFKAYRAKKDDGPTLFQLAQVLARTRGPTDPNTLNAARSARALAPWAGDIALYEARLDLLAGDRERAIRALGPLSSNPHQPEQAARMRAAVEAIRAGRPQPEIEAMLAPPPPKAP